MTNLDRAKGILAEGHTCVLCKGEIVFITDERGVKPLVEWYESAINLCDFSAADKVVGRGAAFLYLLLGVCEVYAKVISESALKLLQQHGIKVEYGEKAECIINRKKDGICPFECAVSEIEDPQAAYKEICDKMRELKIR